MTDIDALITEAGDLRDRWEKLDTELVGKLREFASWMDEKFPVTSTPSPHKYNPPTRHVPAAHKLYPTPTQHDKWVTLSIEEPISEHSFAFVSDDEDRNWFNLPFAWLQDREKFFHDVLTRTHAADREAEAEAARFRAKEAERLRARLAELEAQ